MFKLYLEDSGTVEFIGMYMSIDDVYKRIDRWFNLHNYHAHYIRKYYHKGRMYIDFGDWRKLFYVVK